MITDIFTDTGVVLRLVTVIVSVYVVVSSAEYVAAREHLRDDGIMSWRVSGRRRVFSLPVVSQLATLTMPYPRFLVVLVLRGVLGLLAIGFALRGSLVPVVLGGIAVTTFAISFRHPYGLEGGFQMAFVTVVSVFIASLF